MKKEVLVALAGALLVANGTAQAADVSIGIDGVRAQKGPLYVSLQTAAQFLKNEGTYGKIIPDPKAGKMTVVLNGVAPGEYSVSVWHDVDKDGVFDRTDAGLPLDGWSMFNAAALRGEPRFDEVKFTVSAQGAAIDLDMVYAD